MEREISGAEWLSQQQAADLVGVDVKLVEFASRRGKFVKRDTAPSLQRESVLAWQRDREERARRAAKNRFRRRRRAPQGPPEATGWLELGAAAEMLGIGRPSVHRLAHQGRVERRRSGRQWWARENHVRALAEGRATWVSTARAAEFADCTIYAVEKAAVERRIERRDAPRWLPSLRRKSVERFAHEVRTERAEAARRPAEAPRPVSLPPDDENVWLSTGATAAVLGVSTSWVSEMTRREVLPGIRRGRRWWFRRSDVDRVAAARAARSSRG